ncbi:MAG: RDD family protein [Gammaproteobacteria bacterium]|nr:RDD family protein [Gammaproteobacteria bacterium]MCY4358043.1 RDD family protein [Gammaproteobacteria bacterium]
MAEALETVTESHKTADFPRAGLWRRLLALLYDSFLVAAIWMLLGFLIQLLLGVDSNQVVDGKVQTDSVRDYLLFVIMLGSSFTFYAYFWMQSGQTLGMIAWRLKVVNCNNELLTIDQALKRYFLAWPAMLLAGSGYLWLYFDTDSDALHDRLSGTKVVLVPRSQRPF